MTIEEKSARQAIVEVLGNSDGPVRASEIARRVMKTKGVNLNGKTPAATIMAVLARENQKPNGLFRRRSKGMYELRPEVRQKLARGRAES